MRKLYIATLLCALALGLAAPAAPTVGASDASGGAIGATVADFTLPDADGVQRTLASLKGKNGTVLIFVSTECPVSNAYNARMEKLSQDLKAKGVHLVGINSNVAETPASIKAHAASQKLTFPILKDAGNVVADRLDARVTPEAYFLDASNKLVYRGRIDDSRSGEAVLNNDLRDAVEATLAGKPVARAEARAFGCSIKRG
jgi:peroxiredoxin